MTGLGVLIIVGVLITTVLLGCAVWLWRVRREELLDLEIEVPATSDSTVPVYHVAPARSPRSAVPILLILAVIGVGALIFISLPLPGFAVWLRVAVLVLLLEVSTLLVLQRQIARGIKRKGTARQEDVEDIGKWLDEATGRRGTSRSLPDTIPLRPTEPFAPPSSRLPDNRTQPMAPPSSWLPDNRTQPILPPPLVPTPPSVRATSGEPNNPQSLAPTVPLDSPSSSSGLHRLLSSRFGPVLGSLSRSERPFRYLRLVEMLVVVVIVLEIILLAVFAKPSAATSQRDRRYLIACATHSPQPVAVTLYYSNEDQEWMTAVVKDFNQRQMSACDGAIRVNAVPVESGQSMQDILAGNIQPDIWSPAGSVWLSLLDSEWQAKHGTHIIAADTSDTPALSLLSSPVVIAMLEPQAKALGWPNKPLGWADMEALSANKEGWSAYGHPEWGDFKFAHTHPRYSTSGLDAIIAENYTSAGKGKGLTLGDVTNPQAQAFLTSAESSILYYGGDARFFAQEMVQDEVTEDHLSAAVLSENLVVEANQIPHTVPLVAIYPKEGTFSIDQPFAILQASWLNPAKKAAAQAFGNFLLANEQQQKAVQYGFRPTNSKVSVSAPLDKAHGIDLAQPKSYFQVPSAGVVKTIMTTSWDAEHNKADVMLLLDDSGSMSQVVNGERKIDAATQGLRDFIGKLADSDRVGLTIFNDTINVLMPVSALGPPPQPILSLVSSLPSPAGNTRLFDAIDQQYAALNALSTRNIKALVVLSDGVNDEGQMYDDLLPKITRKGQNYLEGVLIYTIAYGNPNDPNEPTIISQLQEIADVTHGHEYDGNSPQSIQEFYKLISENF